MILSLDTVPRRQVGTEDDELVQTPELTWLGSLTFFCPWVETWLEIWPHLLANLARLSEVWRSAFLLCDLGGAGMQQAHGVEKHSLHPWTRNVLGFVLYVLLFQVQSESGNILDISRSLCGWHPSRSPSCHIRLPEGILWIRLCPSEPSYWPNHSVPMGTGNTYGHPPLGDLKTQQSSWMVLLVICRHLPCSWSHLLGNAQSCCLFDLSGRPSLWYCRKHYIWTLQLPST